MNAPPELDIGSKVATALSLTMTGGFVDAVGYIALFEVFTANMSGNSIHIGMYLAQRDWPNFLRPLCAVASYVLGMLMTRIAIEIAGRVGYKRVASFTFAAEALLLAGFAHARPAMHFGQLANLHSPAYFAFVAMLAFAMGVQTATLTHVGALTLYTTFVTGTLTKMTESITRALFWIWDELPHTGISHAVKNAGGQKDVRQAATLAATWTAYVVGAAAGVVVKARWELHALYAPVAILCIFVVVDRLHPIGVQEEKHQTGS
ncbi:MAG TPA: YoaK family protein [Bryocella sp.]|nr:YoaK family protein [Bryocella sp.]